MKRGLIVFIMVLLISCERNMEYKDFTSEQGWFTMKIPPNWAEYEDEEGTYAFFDTTNWTGNFRVTPLRMEKPNSQDPAKKYIDEEYSENKNLNPIKSTINDFSYVSYTKRPEQNDDNNIIYYWVLGKKDVLFTCSFTINAEKENTADNKVELEKVEKILHSFKLK